MPALPIPSDFHDLLDEPLIGHLATIGPDGRPQVNPVWYLWDGEHLLISMQAVTRKYQNLVANPAMAISIVDPTNPGRYLEIRGDATTFERFLTLEFANQLAVKYTGSEFPESMNGQERFKVTFTPTWWTGQGVNIDD